MIKRVNFPVSIQIFSACVHHDTVHTVPVVNLVINVFTLLSSELGIYQSSKEKLFVTTRVRLVLAVLWRKFLPTFPNIAFLEKGCPKEAYKRARDDASWYKFTFV